MAIREQDLASTTSLAEDDEIRIVNPSHNRRITVENFLREIGYDDQGIMLHERVTALETKILALESRIEALENVE